MSLCTSFFTKVFTLWSHTPPKENAMLGDETPKAAAEKLLNRRERPHFFGFQPPKKCVGSLPPDRSNAGDSIDAFIAHVIAYRSNHVYNRIHFLFN